MVGRPETRVLRSYRSGRDTWDHGDPGLTNAGKWALSDRRYLVARHLLLRADVALFVYL